MPARTLTAAAAALALLLAACSDDPGGSAARPGALRTVAVTALPGYQPSVSGSANEHKVLAVPVQAVARHGRVAVAYVVDYRGGVTRRELEVAPADDEDYLRVLSGLHHGEQVALDPAAAAQAYRAQRQASSP